MKKIVFIAAFIIAGLFVSAQTSISTDSSVEGKVTVFKDSRLDELSRKEAAFNEAMSAAPKSGRGYRLMLLSTNDRPLAMKIRSQLLQRYPDEKVYMSFQPPYIKLKMGNFIDKAEADDFRKELIKNKLITGNIYLVPENIEFKPEELVKDK